MNNSTKNVPTYGDVFSSMEYERKIEQRCWLKKNKSRIVIGSLACCVCLAAIAVLLLVL